MQKSSEDMSKKCIKSEKYIDSWTASDCSIQTKATYPQIVELFIYFSNMWPDLQKPDTIVHFSNFSLINNYNLLSKMYALAKFQPDMLITLRVMALQSSNSKMINLIIVSIGKINYRRLQKCS